jgi:hypothetical protein
MTLHQPRISRGQSGPVLIGLIIRNSTVRQVGNYRSESQLDLARRLEARGYAVRAYDEQGCPAPIWPNERSRLRCSRT